MGRTTKRDSENRRIRKEGKGHILNNKYLHISFLFVLSPHTENLSKSKIEAKQMERPLRIEYPGAYYHDA